MKKETKTLNIRIEAKSAVPVYEQVSQGIKLSIISGYFEPGDQLMSIRDLATRLKIHPNTIAKVYTRLEMEGFLLSKPGSGYFVKVDHRKIQREKKDLFKKVTSEYVAKSMDLGFSLTDMIAELQGLQQPGQGHQRATDDEVTGSPDGQENDTADKPGTGDAVG